MNESNTSMDPLLSDGVLTSTPKCTQFALMTKASAWIPHIVLGVTLAVGSIVCNIQLLRRAWSNRRIRPTSSAIVISNAVSTMLSSTGVFGVFVFEVVAYLRQTGTCHSTFDPFGVGRGSICKYSLLVSVTGFTAFQLGLVLLVVIRSVVVLRALKKKWTSVLSFSEKIQKFGVVTLPVALWLVSVISTVIISRQIGTTYDHRSICSPAAYSATKKAVSFVMLTIILRAGIVFWFAWAQQICVTVLENWTTNEPTEEASALSLETKAHLRHTIVCTKAFYPTVIANCALSILSPTIAIITDVALQLDSHSRYKQALIQRYFAVIPMLMSYIVHGGLGYLMFSQIPHVSNWIEVKKVLNHRVHVLNNDLPPSGQFTTPKWAKSIPINHQAKYRENPADIYHIELERKDNMVLQNIE